ncbi:MAG: hypothetical protein GQ531_03250 [Sulfurovum sp.]|nr:hypothetical protein [Sulfurovum sp.]
MNKLLLLTLTLFSMLTFLHAQEAKIDMHGTEHVEKTTLYYGKILDIKSVSRYQYLKIDEKGETLWIAIEKANISIGDTIGFDKETLMTDFKSSTLNQSFEKIYFVSTLSLPKKRNLTMKEMLKLSAEGK